MLIATDPVVEHSVDPPNQRSFIDLAATHAKLSPDDLNLHH
jgi:hypothetical protein